MCYPKPGPRCSPHAKEKLRLAIEAHKNEPTPRTLAALREASDEYALTPEGIKRLRALSVEKVNAHMNGERGALNTALACLKQADVNAAKRALLIARSKSENPNATPDHIGQPENELLMEADVSKALSELDEADLLQLTGFKPSRGNVEDMEWEVKRLGNDFTLVGFIDYADASDKGHTYRFEKPLDVDALAVRLSTQEPKTRYGFGTPPEGEPDGMDFSEMTNLQKIRAAEVMFGSGTPKHLKAIEIYRDDRR